MVSEVALNVGVGLAILTLGISAMLLLVSAVSWLRLRSAKLLLAGGAFLVLAIKGGIGTWRGVVDREADLPMLVLDAAVLGFLYASVAAR
jgi:hypothetical protein